MAKLRTLYKQCGWKWAKQLNVSISRMSSFWKTTLAIHTPSIAFPYPRQLSLWRDLIPLYASSHLITFSRASGFIYPHNPNGWGKFEPNVKTINAFSIQIQRAILPRRLRIWKREKTIFSPLLQFFLEKGLDVPVGYGKCTVCDNNG